MSLLIIMKPEKMEEVLFILLSNLILCVKKIQKCGLLIILPYLVEQYILKALIFHL